MFIGICATCPYGGACSNGMVKAKSDFWGVLWKHRLFFYPCVSSHCSDNEEKSGYDGCAANRGGIICTECDDGYTEALFAPSCVPDSQCSNHWFWPLMILASILYTLFLIFYDDIMSFLFQSQNKPSGNNLQPSLKMTVAAHQYKTFINKNNNSHFLIILFYYFQDSSLLQVNTPYIKDDTSLMKSIREIVSGLFDFKLNILHLLNDICIITGMTTVQKYFFKLLFIPVLWVSTLTMYIISAKYSHTLYGQKLLMRCSAAFVLAFLFSFQNVGVTMFSLLHCTEIKDTNVLFIDATVECYTCWQIVIIFYVCFSILPFGLFMCVVPFSLNAKIISLNQFILGCFFPIPCIVYCVIVSTCKLYHHQPYIPGHIKVVIDLLQNPYRCIKLYNVHICWGGVVIFRRTLLIVLATFVHNSFLRLVMMFMVSLTSLLHHAVAWPYLDFKANLAECLSESVLVILSFINTCRSVLDTLQHEPTGPTKDIMDMLGYIDDLF